MADSGTYLSREDSMMLRESLKEVKGGIEEAFLEIGVGYGSNIKSVIGKFGLVVGTDIQRTEAFTRSAHSGMELILADRAKSFRNSCFDIVAMNPPYLPSSPLESEVATDGGRTGFEIPKSFIEEALRVLKPGGKIIVILSTESGLDEFKAHCESHNIKTKILLERRIFFETLFVFELRPE